MSALNFHRTISVGASICILILMALALQFPTCFFPTWFAPSEVSGLLFSPNDEFFAAILKHPGNRVLSRVIVAHRHSNAAILDMNGVWPTNICFDQQGRQIAVQWADALRMYELSTGRCISAIERREFDHRKFSERGLSSMAFSDDGQSIILASDQWADTPMEAAWHVDSGLLTENKRPASIWSGPGLAPDRTKWFVGGWPGPSPRVDDRKDGRFIAACVHNSFPIFASFTRDSENVLTYTITVI